MVRSVLGIALVLASIGLGCDSTPAPAVEEEKKAAKAPAPKPVPAKPTAPDPEPAPTLELPKTLLRADAIAKAIEIHGKRRTSFFCGCSYTPAMRTIRQSCGYRTRADDSLAHDVVWAHVAPPDVFGAHRKCWMTEACRRADGKPFGGIECCRQTDPVFAAIEGDLHNLVPVIGEIAKDRSDHHFGDVKGEVRMYGACDIEVDGTAALVEPPPKSRGDIARIYLYLRAIYGSEVVATPQEWALFEAWNVEDPPDAWELERAAAITAVQGVPHPLLDGAGGAAPKGAAPANAPADGKAAGGDTKAEGQASPAGGAQPSGGPKAPAGEAKAPAGAVKPAAQPPAAQPPAAQPPKPAAPVDPAKTG